MRKVVRRSGFTLVELIVVIAILAILAGILFPLMAQAREKARAAVCLSNCRQVALGIEMYNQDYDEAYPLYVHWPGHDQWWYEVIQPYIRSEGVFVCPSVSVRPEGFYGHYGWSGYGVNWLHLIRYGPGWSWVTGETAGPAYRADLGRPAETIMVADSQAEAGYARGWGWPAVYCPIELPEGPSWHTEFGLHLNWGLSDRHHGGGNYVFADGHCRWMKRDTVLQWSRAPGREMWGHFHE